MQIGFKWLLLLLTGTTVFLPTVLGQYKHTALRPRATESVFFVVSSQFRKNTDITHIIMYRTNMYLSSFCLLWTRTFRTKHVCFYTAHASSENCPSERCLHTVANSTHHPPTTYASKPNKCRHLLPYSFFMTTTINTGSLRPPPRDFLRSCDGTIT